MAFKMGYTNPAANAAVKAAKQKAARNYFGRKVYNVILGALEPRLSRMEMQIRANAEAKHARDPSGIFEPLPHGIDRPHQHKRLDYCLPATGSRGVILENIHFHVGDSVPAAQIEDYQKSRKHFSGVLKAYSALGVSPMFFIVTPVLNEAGEPISDEPDQAESRFISERSGYGVLGDEFITDDPKHLAADLAFAQIELAERNLKLVLAVELEPHGSDFGATILDHKHVTPENISEDVPPFSADAQVIVKLHFNGLDLGDDGAPLCLRPGDRVLANSADVWRNCHDELVGFYAKLRNRLPKIARAAVPEHCAHLNAFVRAHGAPPAAQASTSDMERMTRTVVAQVGTPEFWDEVLEDFHKGTRLALSRDGADVGHAELPFSFDEEQLAHLAARLDAMGYEMQIRAAD